MSRPTDGSFSLSADQIERYARQIIIPGIGGEGQSKLCSAWAFVDGHPDGARIAAQYLRAAGVLVAGSPTPPPRIDCVVIAGATDLSTERLDMLAHSAPVLAWYMLTERGLRGGVTNRKRPPVNASPSLRYGQTGFLAAAHRLAGADVATTAIAAILGWLEPEESYEVDLI